ncbi:MAG: YdeI/OmpD-associated family protein [Polyangiales bacterium]
MPPVVIAPRTIQTFDGPRAFEKWLRAHHGKETEVYLRIYKKAAGVPTITHEQALDVALCWGWIDGLRKGHDAQSFLQRFTPRKPKSRWSQVNRDKVARLIDAGRMTPRGLREIDAAKADGRWDEAYAPQRSTTLPDDLRAAIAAEPRAVWALEGLSAQNRFALSFRLSALKTPAGRARKLGDLVAMLARGETPHPNRAPTVKKVEAAPTAQSGRGRSSERALSPLAAPRVKKPATKAKKSTKRA